MFNVRITTPKEISEGGKIVRELCACRSAGQDELTIKCEGPHGKKALSELNDHRDGRFTLYIRPQVRTGTYKLWVVRYLRVVRYLPVYGTVPVLTSYVSFYQDEKASIAIIIQQNTVTNLDFWLMV